MDQVAAILQVDPSTLYHPAYDDLPRIRLGRTVRVLRSSLLAWLKAREEPAAGSRRAEGGSPAAQEPGDSGGRGGARAGAWDQNLGPELGPDDRQRRELEARIRRLLSQMPHTRHP